MPSSSCVSLRFSPELAVEIDELVTSGQYASASDLVEAVMLHWFESRRGDDLIEEIGLDEVRRLVQEGIDSGPGEPVDIEEIIAEARRGHGTSQ